MGLEAKEIKQPSTSSFGLITPIAHNIYLRSHFLRNMRCKIMVPTTNRTLASEDLYHCNPYFVIWVACTLFYSSSNERRYHKEEQFTERKGFWQTAYLPVCCRRDAQQLYNVVLRSLQDKAASGYCNPVILVFLLIDKDGSLLPTPLYGPRLTKWRIAEMGEGREKMDRPPAWNVGLWGRGRTVRPWEYNDRR
jgi:hypothetical protein